MVREWRQVKRLATKPGLEVDHQVRVRPGKQGVVLWGRAKTKWPVTCTGVTYIKGVKMFIFVGRSWKKKQVQSSIYLTRREAVEVIKLGRS